MNINININKEINIDKKIIKIIIAVVVGIIFLGIVFAANGKEKDEVNLATEKVQSIPSVSSENVLVFKKLNNSGMQDLTMVGHFSENRLETYEISYYIPYDNAEYAQDDYTRMINGIIEKDEIRYHYSVDDNRLYTSMEYIVRNMDQSFLESNFGVENAESITKKRFTNYAQSQGYVLAQ